MYYYFHFQVIQWLHQKMSVYVPIYHRILYGSSDSPAQEQCKQDLSSDKQLLPMDKNDNFVKVKMQPEIQPTTRQTMSAPLLPVSSVNNVQPNSGLALLDSKWFSQSDYRFGIFLTTSWFILIINISKS